MEQHEDWAGTCLSLAFLDDETLAISGNCHKLTILHVSGKVLLQQQFPKELISPIIGCSGCDLVAGYTYVLKGGSSWLDTFPKGKDRSIVILNRKTHELVQWPDRIDSKVSSSMALSPDGCFLAVQKDALLRVYRICGSPIGQKLSVVGAKSKANADSQEHTAPNP